MVGLKVKEALATEIAEQTNNDAGETQITNWHGTYTGGGVLYNSYNTPRQIQKA